ncbi:LysR substrate-binding domain-containing protein [Paracoccus methylarcula]|uniref:LysR family transcriptional regulator n=1 Tax=Paracoccus methylarcula TaxID=72022 RepID=A0A422QWH3_9RHOB|nr:LysR substrate-binding domain-containing protein [Paracoccus methylarcula]RNF34327.1 LysR family transcriptional regulator [Paracoccus methylarcula]
MTRKTKEKRKRLPPLNWLRAFEVAARHMSFTIAADELSLTQAAISQQIRGLEAHLGVELFKRLPRGVALTEAGRAYLPAVRDGIDRMAVATEEIFGSGRIRELTLRINLVFLVNWLAPRLRRFRANYPDIVLRFSSNIWVEERERKEADIEVRYGNGLWDGLTAMRLTRDTLMPVCAPWVAEELAGASVEEALTRHGMLHVIGYGEGWGYWLRECGITGVDPSSGLQFDTLISALAMAENGMGFALARSELNGHLFNRGTLIAPFQQRIPSAEAFYALRRTNAVRLPQVEAFWQWLEQEAYQDDPDVPDGDGS